MSCSRSMSPTEPAVDRSIRSVRRPRPSVRPSTTEPSHVFQTRPTPPAGGVMERRWPVVLTPTWRQRKGRDCDGFDACDVGRRWLQVPVAVGRRGRRRPESQHTADPLLRRGGPATRVLDRLGPGSFGSRRAGRGCPGVGGPATAFDRDGPRSDHRRSARTRLPAVRVDRRTGQAARRRARSRTWAAEPSRGWTSRSASRSRSRRSGRLRAHRPRRPLAHARRDPHHDHQRRWVRLALPAGSAVRLLAHAYLAATTHQVTTHQVREKGAEPVQRPGSSSSQWRRFGDSWQLVSPGLRTRVDTEADVTR